MSGENINDQDPDSLNDDFVIEDLAKSEDLDELFPTPQLPSKGAAKPSPAEAEDILFGDPEQVPTSDTFEAKAQFAENAASAWDGEALELDEVGVPDSGDEAEHPVGLEHQIPKIKDKFAEELGSLLQSEEEFALDSEQELELLDAVDGGNPEEFEVSGPFVLDDGDGAWQEQPAEGDEPDAGDEVVAASDSDEQVELAVDDADQTEVEEGWEPLPSSSVDELAEVSEVAHTDDGNVPQYQRQSQVDPEDVDGHDIYGEDEEQAVVHIGPRPGRSRVASVIGTLAAMLLLFFAVGVVIARPEWFGLKFEAQKLEQVQISRPEVRVVASAPPVPEATAALIAAADTPPTPTPGGTDPELPSSTDPVAVVTDPPSNPDTPVVETTPVVASVPDQPPASSTPDTTPGSADPQVVEPPVDVSQGVPGTESSWPVAVAQPRTVADDGGHSNPLLRIGDNLMVGEQDPNERPVRAIDGVMPGSRTFAQLHNGNYFVGNVKCIDEQSITLNMEKGEVTLRTADIEKLTELGSRDYEELQRATSGFVRLTNNNRLVGGILSRIADDHIVLEFRSNRVMLPRSAVGEIVQGANDAAVRLDTTREEDDWLRRIAERQLGTGQAATEEPDEKRPPAKTPR